jgi:hypothetical protein
MIAMGFGALLAHLLFGPGGVALLVAIVGFCMRE